MGLRFKGINFTLHDGLSVLRVLIFGWFIYLLFFSLKKQVVGTAM